MEKKSYIRGKFIYIMFFTIFLFLKTAGAETVSIVASDDALVKETDPSANYVSNSLRVRSDTGKNVHTFIKFRINPQEEAVEKVTLALSTRNDADITSIAVYGVDDTLWDEEHITWASRPESDVLLHTRYHVAGGSNIALDVTGYVSPLISRATGDCVVAFRLGTDDSRTQRNLHSKETNRAKAPTLIIDTHDKNRPPSFHQDQFSKADAAEDRIYTRTIAGRVSDPDEGDTVTFSKVSGPSWLTVTAGGDISGIPSNADVGLNQFSIRVTDQDGAWDEAIMSIMVTNENDAPSFRDDVFEKASATEDMAYHGSIAEEVTDVDVGDTLNFYKTSGPPWLSVATDGRVYGTPANDDVGLNEITVKVRDGAGSVDEALLIIYVTNTNDAPSFRQKQFTKADAEEDRHYTRTIAGRVSDPDEGDMVRFAKVSGPSWLTVSAGGDISGIPENADVGYNHFIIRATDRYGAWDDAVLTILVTNTNDMPTFKNLPGVFPEATEDVPYSFVVADFAHDDDNDSLTFSKISGPSWLSVDATGNCSGTPGRGDIGHDSLKLRVVDSNGAICDATVGIDVAAGRERVRHWTGPIDPGGGGQIVDIEIDRYNDDNLFVLINSGGLRKSTDGGDTWEIQNRGLNYEEFGFDASSGWFIGLHPENSQVLLRSTRYGEIYLSTDGGETWQMSHSERDRDPEGKFCDFTYDTDDGNVVYTAFGGDNHLLTANYSYHNGQDNLILCGKYDEEAKAYRWETVLEDMGLLEKEWVYSMDVSKEDGGTYLYMTVPFGFYKGEIIDDGGELKIEMLTSLSGSPGLPEAPYLEGCKVVVDDGTPGRIYLTVGNRANAFGGVYRSEDYGKTFALLTAPQGYDPLDIGRLNTRFFTLAVSPADEKVLYASMVNYKYNEPLTGHDSGTLMRSMDDGITWEPMFHMDNMSTMGWKDYRTKHGRKLFSINRMATCPTNPAVFYASTGAGSHLFRTDEATLSGPRWEIMSARMVAGGTSSSYTVGYPAIAFQWSMAMHPQHPETLIVPYGDHGIFVSENGGQSMGLRVEHGPNGLGETYGGTLVVDKEDPSVWYYALQGPHMKLKSGAVIKFTDNGSHWTFLGGEVGNERGFPRGAACDLLVEYGDGGGRTLYVTNYNSPAKLGGVYRSIDGGAFTRIFEKANARVMAQSSDFTTIYVGADGRGIFKLTRNGDHWDSKKLYDSGKGNYGSVFYAMKTGHTSGNIYVATDMGLMVIDGNDQMRILKSGRHYWDVAINPHNEDILYIVSDHGEGIMRSFDRGQTWERVGDSLPTLNTMRLSVDPQAKDTVYVGTKSCGIWKCDFSR